MSELSDALLAWHAHHGRHDLPWQHPRTPYRVWVSEVMLQQTQVVTVIPYFIRFMRALPDVPSLARAEQDSIFALWSGLGYYRRARNLQQAAKLCCEKHDGRLPDEFDALLALPGIGRSTAGAILAQAHDLPWPILDGNAKRVLARYHAVEGWPGKPAVQQRLWKLAQRHTPEQQAADYTQAIMDLGAMICTRANPNCAECPLSEHCMALARDRVGKLPTPRPPRKLPTRQVHMLVLEDAHGRVLLRRRGPHGVWSGLWSLPETEDPTAVRRQASQLARIDGHRVQALAPFRHGFTHYRLDVQPLRWRGVSARRTVADNDDDLRWCDAATIASLGVPAPVRRLLQQLKEKPT